MPIMEWNQTMSVGIESIDREHKQLVAMLNELYDGVQAGNGKETLARILDGLILYTRVHFSNEEGYFAKTGYAEAEPHKREHEKLVDQVHEVQKKFETEPTATLSLDAMVFLKNWLIDHIQGTDKKYAAHLIANGIR